ncbi:3-carboxy-cis,cis-muconate cycloisomerase [Rhodoferax saidenbachensis]|uniref:3-carboxy-cis,cis-muconate cycloisomerase n=1 Tax=Rhodoferax saidenbachensis TaxID=1484693 RepID=A0ABU1ZJU2_9BURK|nr:3-carboxy-cis,cis-muconate cycloisomerase [Rhodoferax saidenbachensis]MDR7304831.1 3-carboxy-cis,cis-muconate cycloisomerase [Rhodoferax saidenbachensis]
MGSVFEEFLQAPELLDAFGAQRFVAAMLQFESALAQAQASCGLIPAAAAQSIVGTCKVELFDAPKIVRDSVRAGSLAIPLVKSLQETVGLFNPGAVACVHLDCTKQDLVDTATVLITRDVLERVHSDVQLCVHTLQTQGSADAAAPLLRALQRLQRSAAEALAVQLGGTLAQMRAQGQNQGSAVEQHMAQHLRLGVPQAPWHTQRDAWVALGCDLGLLVGSLGTLAKEMTRRAASDQLPTGCLTALAAARRAPQRVASLLASMPEAHERALGVWQAEQAEWAQLLMSAHASAHGMAQALQQISDTAP